VATLWEYETIKANEDDLKDDLNRLGKLGYQVIHLSETSDHYFVVLARDTGRPIDEGEDKQEWLVDVVTGGDG